jgi:hypothetical protein
MLIRQLTTQQHRIASDYKEIRQNALKTEQLKKEIKDLQTKYL